MHFWQEDIAQCLRNISSVVAVFELNILIIYLYILLAIVYVSLDYSILIYAEMSNEENLKYSLSTVLHFRFQ